jgi:hypothetical protein
MPPFFDSYAPYLALRNSGFYSQAVDQGVHLLREMKRFVPTEYETTPKGTPFYHLGIAAFLAHDYETANFLIDAAASEDLKHNPGRADAPALLFMQLNDRNKKQAAYEIVKVIADKIRELLKRYNARAGRRALTLAQVRTHFLRRLLAPQQPPHLRTLVTTFITFCLEWDYRSRLIELSEAGSREPFFAHLFKGCLLFENLIKQNPIKRVKGITLGAILKGEVWAELRLPAPLMAPRATFPAIVHALAARQPLEATIRQTVQTRNTLGHNLVWLGASLDATKYDQLAEDVAVTCLHTISCLYRK